ncbi:MAG: transposase [Stigonema ocellatum SAG 48.90 = DSM 106950]|nr:transposase [Stigonema ocellatum SAG 48.90 = DSM 106950]
MYGKNQYKKSQNQPPNSLAKIPIYPCEDLHKIWKQWLAAYRWVYNQCVEFLNSGLKLPKGLSLDQHIQNLQRFPYLEWTQCLGKTRQEAVCEAEQAFRQALRAMNRKPKKERTSVRLKFRSCRDNSEAIKFKNDAYKSGTWFPTKVKGLLYCTAWGYEIPIECKYGTQLLYQHGQWFACFPEVKKVPATGSNKVIAFDPGNRTFLTGYDGENILEIGKGDIGRITRLCLHLDRLISQKVKARGKAYKKYRYKLSRSIAKLRVRIQNIVNDVHLKAASLIVNSYKLVFLPTYETSQMVLKTARKINRKSVRNMLTWAFGRFDSHLEQAAKRRNVLIIRTNESYTSKTCPHCGEIHHNLGGNKVFKCPSCGFKYPRDWVGAVNNLLAALQATAFSVQGNQLSIGSTELADVRVTQFHEECET